jgi:hypothetical protein
MRKVAVITNDIRERLVDFSFLCKEYGLTADNDLSPGARKLKGRIIKVVQEFYENEQVLLTKKQEAYRKKLGLNKK